MYRKYASELQAQNSFGLTKDKNANMAKKDAKDYTVDELWGMLSKSDSKSLLKKHLTKEVYEKYKNVKTSLGGTLADCIRSGSCNLDSGVGLYACDPEAYTTFKNLFDAVIKDYHKVSGLNHPKPNFGDINKLDFGDLDPKGELIISTRVRVGRSHEGYSFPPSIKSSEDRKDMEKKTIEALNTLEGDLKGKYYSLETMSKEDQKQLIDDHFLFKDDDRFLRDAGGYSFWPEGRGIFHNPSKTFLVWINEEDHLRFISMQQGGNLAEVYKRLVNAINQLEKKLTFAKKDGYGYLTFCPTNLGTTLRASVHIKVPKLAAANQLNDICAKFNLQPRGIHGEHTESEGGVYDISNKRRLGLSEIEAIEEMRKGVQAVIEAEKKLK